MSLRLQTWHDPPGVSWRVGIVWIICGAWFGWGTADTALAQDSRARFIQERPGGGEGVLIKCDLQHRFSEDYLSVVQFITQAVDNGCQAVCVSPPNASNSPATLMQFLQDVETARLVFPKVVILPAYSWVIKASEFTDHAMILLPPGEDFSARFLQLADIVSSPTSTAPISETAGLILKELCPETMPPSQWPVVIFNEHSDGVILHRWSVEASAPDALWSAGTGQTRAQRVFGQIGLMDRWDSIEIYAGGKWDQLLADGWNAWAASGGLDLYHARAQTLKPGGFTETWVRVPEVTAEHVFQALKHGAFFGVRGQAAREVELKLTVPGLSRAAYSGETIDVPIGTPVRLTLSLQVPDQDWRKTPHRLDGIELIAVTPQQSLIVKKESAGSGQVKIEYETQVPEGGVLFRAIGYREVKDGPDYGFTTNPIRVIAAGQWVRPETVVPSEPWLSHDYGPFVILGMTFVLAVATVAGWLGYTGKLALLFGDFLTPVKKRWQASWLRRVLITVLPGLRRHRSSDHSTVGTVLSATECRSLLITLVVSLAVLGAHSGWVVARLEGTIPFVPAGVWGKVLLGAMLGALCGGMLRTHAFLGFWFFLLAKMAAGIWPGAIPVAVVTDCLAGALIGCAIHDALRAGTLRWPASMPVGGVLGLAVALVASSFLSNWLPGWIGSFALLSGIMIATSWSSGNLEWGRVPLRGLAVSFVVALWFGLRLTHGCPAENVGTLPCIVDMLAEAIGVGLLCIACRPERLDGLGLLLGQAALAMLAVLMAPEQAIVPSELAAAAAGIGVLLCLAADVPLLTALSAGVAILGLGRLLLFSPEVPGLWLAGATACVAACLVSHHRIRLALFFLPYLAVSGYQLCFAPGAAVPSAELLPAMFQRELSPLTHIAGDNSLNTLQAAGQMLSLFSLAGSTVLYWSIRQKLRHDIFDALGRATSGGLLLSGALSILSFPLQGAAGWMLASCAGLWAAQIRQEDLAATAALKADEFADRTLNSFRRRLGLAAVVIAGLIAYGSLVPFHWRETTGWEAIQEFIAQFHHQYARGRLFFERLNSDRLVNICLTIPLAFCAYGSMVLGRRGVVCRVWAVVEAWQMSLVFSFFVELAQHWSIGRVASVQDVVAQGIGAGIGIAIWIVMGEWFVLRLAATAQERTTEGRWGQLLWPYMLGVLVFAVLPAGMPVTSPRQLFDRYRDGQVCLTPFADCKSWSDVVRDVVAGIVLFFPVGVWGALSFRRAGQPIRSIWSSAANGVAFAALITVLRALCSIKMTDSSWLVTGFLGAALGAASLHALVNSEADRYAGWKAGLGWWIGSVAFAAVIAGFFLHPWVFDASPEQITHGWRNFIRTPFAGFHSGNDWLLIEEVVRKLAWFAGLGLLLGQAVLRSTEFRLGRIVGGLVAILIIVAAAAGTEIAQLYQSHHSGEITDVLVYITGALAGLWLRWAWLTASAEELPPPNRSTTTTSKVSELPAKSWLTILQTAIAVGLAIGLLVGIVVLMMRR